MEKYKLPIFPSGSNGVEEDVGLGLEKDGLTAVLVNNTICPTAE